MFVNFVPFRDEPRRSLICVVWQNKNDHRNLKGNTILFRLHSWPKLFGKSVQISEKNSFNVSLHHPLHSHQGSSLAAQIKIKYAEEYSIRQVVEIFKD